MQRRRQHFECESRPGLGCLVYGTPKCANKPRIKRNLKYWLGKMLTVEFFLIVFAILRLLPLIGMSVWAVLGGQRSA